MELLTKHTTANNPVLKLVTAIVFIVLPIIGFALGLQYQVVVNNSFQVNKYPKLDNPTKLNDNVSNWKTYTDSTRGYTIRYPSDLLVRIICPGEQLLLTKRDNQQEDEITMPICNRGGPYTIEGGIIDQKSFIEPTSNEFFQVTKKTLTINNYKATQYTSQQIKTGQGGSYYQTVLLENNNQQFWLTLSNQDLLNSFNKILSTFKFLNNQQTNTNINWETYNSSKLGVSFEYSSHYDKPQENENYISLMSPLNPNRGKGYQLQNDELKIEIVFLQPVENDSLEKFVDYEWSNSSGLAKLSGKSDTYIAGIKAVKWSYEGEGDGDIYALLYQGKRILINKYPVQTTRQAEFEHILSTLKFSNMNNSSTTESKKQPDSDTPAAGICEDLRTKEVILTINNDFPTPRCAKVASLQTLQVKNNTDKTISVSLANYSFNIDPGNTHTVNEVFGGYLLLGVHKLKVSSFAGPEIWLQ